MLDPLLQLVQYIKGLLNKSILTIAPVSFNKFRVTVSLQRSPLNFISSQVAVWSGCVGAHIEL